MRYGKSIGIVIFALSVLLLLSTSFLVTPFSVNDNDPSTYVIVPLLMLPLFALFLAKEDFVPNVKRGDAVLGIAMFAVFAASTVLLRFYFSFVFLSFRIDLLLMPLAIAAMATLIFGAGNVSKFRWLLIYALLSSPAVLFPALASYKAFTQANSVLVYYIVKLFLPAAQYIPPITISANGYNIGIGQACVSIGIFIALALFMLPVAYLYNGKAKSKVVWVVGALIMLFILNIVRMLSVSYVWLASGPSNTVLFVHAFIGVLLFYVVIIVMMLLAGKFGLSLRPRKKAARPKRRPVAKGAFAFALVAGLLALFYLYLTSDYASALTVSPIALGNRVPFNYTNPAIVSQINTILNRHNFTSFVVSTSEGNYAVFSLSNKTISAATPLVMLVIAPSAGVTESIEKNSTVFGRLSFLNKMGVEESVADVISNSSEFLVYNTDVSLVYPNMSSTVESIYMLIPPNLLQNSTCASDYIRPANAATYAIALQYNTTVRRNMFNALCMSNRIVWS